MKKILRRFVSFSFKFIPSKNYVYDVILRPKPLRYFVKRSLLELLVVIQVMIIQICTVPKTRCKL
jgi:hypothetical protein